MTNYVAKFCDQKVSIEILLILVQTFHYLNSILGGNPSGIPGFHPGNFPGSHGTTFFHPTLGGPPGQFGNQFRFPGAGRGLGRGFLPGGGRGFIPRGRGGRGRGGHRPQNERIVNAEEEKPPDLETIECEEKSPEELTAILPVPGSSAIPIIDPDKDIVVNPSTNIVASSEQNGEKQDDAASNDEPPKNVISGQVSCLFQTRVRSLQLCSKNE